MLLHDQRWQQQARTDGHRMALQLAGTPDSRIHETTGTLVTNVLVSLLGVTILTVFICASSLARPSPPPNGRTGEGEKEEKG